MRSSLYLIARVLGDVSAVSKGPAGIVARIIRKVLFRGAASIIRRIAP